MLAVDIQKLPADLPQLGHGDRPSVDPADVFSLAGNFPLEHQVPVLVRHNAVFRQSRQVRRHAGKFGADKGLGRAGAD